MTDNLRATDEDLADDGTIEVDNVKRRFLILGHPRGGTGYTAELFRAFGYNIGHEVEREDGISCWAWATWHPDPPWAPGQRDDDTFTDVIHVTRHPLSSAQSIPYTETNDLALSYMRRYVPYNPNWSPETNAVHSLVTWHAIIDAQNPDLHLQIEDAVGKLTAYLGRGPDGSLPHNEWNSRRRATYRTKRTDREVYDALDTTAKFLARRYAERYGYELIRS